MKIKHLINQIKDLDPETEVVLGGFDEDEFFELEEQVDSGIYDEENGTFDNEDLTGDGKRAICIWPK